MSAELIDIHPDNPQKKRIEYVVEQLNLGKIIIYPTDSVYNFGCALNNKRAIERIAKLKKLKLKDANFSLVFNSISEISEYTKQYSRSTFKIMNKALPGPYTFILPANNQVSRLFDNKKREVGVRIPNNKICNDIVDLLGQPIVTSSVREDDDVNEYLTDPEVIFDEHKYDVDIIISGGIGNLNPSTVINCLNEDPIVIREGIGNIDLL